LELFEVLKTYKLEAFIAGVFCANNILLLIWHKVSSFVAWILSANVNQKLHRSIMDRSRLTHMFLHIVVCYLVWICNTDGV
jgi:hypothetical protein